MLAREFKEQWTAFRRSQPGFRFRERYERQRQSQRSWWSRLLEFAIGVVLILGGLFFVVAPGPASPFFFLGGGLLASESLTVAKLMDWVEVKSWAVIARGRKRWRKLSRPAKATVIALSVAGSGACAFLSYALIFR